MRSRFVMLGCFFALCRSALAGCGATTFQPQQRIGPVTAHQALWISDPANEQYAHFDIEWGGTLASLRYDPFGHVLDGNGVVNPAATELIWGHHPGGMVQPAWFFGTQHPYNPEGAGDQGDQPHSGRGTPVLGAACKFGSLLLMYSGSTDWFQNEGFWGRAATVKNEDVKVDMWATPYAITTTVTFVANPSGTPAYYLKLDQYVMNFDARENLSFDFGHAVYTPGTTNPPNPDTGLFDPDNGPGSFKYFAYYPQNPDCRATNQQPPTCPAHEIPKLVAGRYPNPGLTGGVAFSVAASTYYASPNNSIRVKQNPGGGDLFWNNTGFGVGGLPVPLAPGTGRRIVFYILAGNWSAAQAFEPQ